VQRNRPFKPIVQGKIPQLPNALTTILYKGVAISQAGNFSNKRTVLQLQPCGMEIGKPQLSPNDFSPDTQSNTVDFSLGLAPSAKLQSD